MTEKEMHLQQQRYQAEQNIPENTNPAEKEAGYTLPVVPEQPIAEAIKKTTGEYWGQKNRPSEQQPAADTAYNQAMGALQAAGKPTYNPSYDAQIKDIYNQIMGRESFSYDLSDDTLYQMYKQNYADMGRLSMRDSMGQAAALTGGYGSSYGQAVGQQAYDSYLQQLNDVVPELYAQAYGRYQDEGDRLMQQYGLVGDLAADEYAKYQDAYNRYYTEQAYNYERLMDLINATGYEPTEEEAAAAGLTKEQVEKLLKAWQIQNKSLYNKINGIKTGGGGGTYYGGNPGSEEDLTMDELKAARDKILALNKAGYYTLEDAEDEINRLYGWA